MNSFANKFEIYIFYSQNYWHHLIKHCILPFVSEERKNYRPIEFNIYLNTQQGDHVIIDFNSVSDNGFKERAYQCFNQFIMLNPSFPSEIIALPSGFFLNYTNNTIYFNPSFQTNRVSNLIIIERQLTEIISKVLASEEIDIENLFTLVIYLQIGILKAAYHHRLEHGILELIANLERNYFAESVEHEILHSTLEENRDMIVEIFNEVNSENSFDSDFEWLSKWIEVCQLHLNEGQIVIESVLSIIKLVFENLGFKTEKLILSSLKLIYQSISTAH